MEAHSNKTELYDRTLWFDGDSTVEESQIIDMIMSGTSTEHLFVNQITDNIRQFNRNVPESQKIQTKKEVGDYSLQWNLPDQYMSINVWEWLIEKIMIQFNVNEKQSLYQDDHIAEYTSRCIEEYKLYKHYDLFNVLRALIYVINTLHSNNIVWGVGRGSSVSSYILFLIGVHDIDSVKYQLDIHDFLPAINNTNND